LLDGIATRILGTRCRDLPKYIPRIGINEVVPLSRYTYEYDMMRDDGFKNIGAWIDLAFEQGVDRVQTCG
jgi:hypothetical protein